MIALGGNDYDFTGVDGEHIYPNSNMLILKIDGNLISKRRLFSYGEQTEAIGFIENSTKLVGLTETSIIIWNLKK